MSSRYAAVERGREGGGFQSRSEHVLQSPNMCVQLFQVLQLWSLT